MYDYYILSIIFLFVIGTALASFINVLVWRIHKKVGFVKGRSYCESCSNELAWYHNIPVLSYFILRGSCAFCHKKIPRIYPVSEFVLGLFFLFIFYWYQFSFSLEFFRDLIILLFLFFIFLYDFRFREILDIPTLVFGSVFFAFSGVLGWHSWASMVIGILIGSGFFLLQYVVSKGKWIGGGDIRLGFLMGVILGWPQILVALFIAYLLGAVSSLVLVAMKKKKLASETAFGTYLTLATFVTMFFGNQVLDWYLGII